MIRELGIDFVIVFARVDLTTLLELIFLLEKDSTVLKEEAPKSIHEHVS